nr:hypothetical protein [Halapricum desulfuricans]
MSTVWCGPKIPPAYINNRSIIHIHSKEVVIPFIASLAPRLITKYLHDCPVSAVIAVVIWVRLVGNVDPDAISLGESSHSQYRHITPGSG